MAEISHASQAPFHSCCTTITVLGASLICKFISLLVKNCSNFAAFFFSKIMAVLQKVEAHLRVPRHRPATLFPLLPPPPPLRGTHSSIRDWCTFHCNSW